MLAENCEEHHNSTAPGTIACVFNGSARSYGAAEAKNRLIELFKARGANATVLVAEQGVQIPELAKRAIGDGAAILVAAGGDGTVNAVASVIINSQAALGVLPVGTLNHFAKDVGIPLDLEAAVQNLFTGQVARVDVGTVNGKIFLNNSSLGLYPAIVRQRDDLQKKGHAKWTAFAAATMYALRRYQRLYVRLQTEVGPEVEEETPFVFVGNNQYRLSGLRLGERYCVNAGDLWVYRAPRASRLGLLRLAFEALRGTQDGSELAVLSVKSLSVGLRKRLVHVARDGEVEKMQGPLNYGILPQALQVIVPKTLPRQNS